MKYALTGMLHVSSALGNVSCSQYMDIMREMSLRVSCLQIVMLIFTSSLEITTFYFQHATGTLTKITVQQISLNAQNISYVSLPIQGLT
jgi:hypothetical protein